MKNYRILAFSLLAAVAVSACSDGGDVNVKSYEWGMTIDEGEAANKAVNGLSFHKLAITKDDSSCTKYREHILDNVAYQIARARFSYKSPFYYEYCYEDWLDYEKGEINEGLPGASDDNMTNEPDGGSAGEFTVTNTQEAGVDEVDSVKNNGNYMYVIKNSEIHVVKVWPAEEMAEVSKIDRFALNGDSDWSVPHGLLLSGDNLISIETSYGYYNGDVDEGSHKDFTIIRVFDVSEGSAPKLVKTHKIEGSYVDARLINGRVHLISSTNNYYFYGLAYELASREIPGVPRFIVPWSDAEFNCKDWDESQWNQYNSAVRQWNDAIEGNVEKYLPAIRGWLEKAYPNFSDIAWPQHAIDGGELTSAISCDKLYVPGTMSQNMGYLLISEISGDKFEKFDASALTDQGWLVYASKDNLYIASNSNAWWYDASELSHIHHFNLGDAAGGVKYVNSAELDGYINNSFWMSEYKDHLRVVSSPSWGNSPEGHTLSIFDIHSKPTMSLTGSVSGFGKDERVYAARMFGDKGYVVTFRNTDPLFTFDLSEPTAPKQVGELKINGYSSYIHAMDEDHLLTIGEDADENGSILGMHLQVFDVSDLANPVRKYHTLINNKTEDGDFSYAWSEALHNHHAINYHNASGLLAIPVNINSWSYSNESDQYNYNNFSGMFVYRVKAESDFEFLGGVDHSDFIDNDYNWWTNVDRARFYFKTPGVYDKDAYIYTISNLGIKACDANAPDKDIKGVKF